MICNILTPFVIISLKVSLVAFYLIIENDMQCLCMVFLSFKYSLSISSSCDGHCSYSLFPLKNLLTTRGFEYRNTMSKGFLSIS